MRRNVKPLPPPSNGGDDAGGSARSRLPRILAAVPLALTAEAEALAPAAAAAADMAGPRKAGGWCTGSIGSGEGLGSSGLVYDDFDACYGIPSVVDGKGRGEAARQREWYGAAAPTIAAAAATAAAVAAAPRPGTHLLPGRTSSLAARRSDSMGGATADGMLGGLGLGGGGLGGSGGGGILLLQLPEDQDADVVTGAEEVERRPAPPARKQGLDAISSGGSTSSSSGGSEHGGSRHGGGGGGGGSSSAPAQRVRAPLLSAVRAPSASVPAAPGTALRSPQPQPELSASFQQWVSAGSPRRAAPAALGAASGGASRGPSGESVSSGLTKPAAAPVARPPAAGRDARGGAAAPVPAAPALRSRTSDDALAESDSGVGSPLRAGARNPNQLVRAGESLNFGGLYAEGGGLLAKADGLRSGRGRIGCIGCCNARTNIPLRPPPTPSNPSHPARRACGATQVADAMKQRAHEAFERHFGARAPGYRG
jgi:hypothetical protein